MKRIAIAVCLSILPLAAQNSSLQGTVTDMQGGIVPSAIITVTNADTSAGRKAVSDDSGHYSFLQMPPGEYKIEVEKPGFSTYQSETRLQVNSPLTLNIGLEIGKTTDTVNFPVPGMPVWSVKL